MFRKKTEQTKVKVYVKVGQADFTVKLSDGSTYTKKIYGNAYYYKNKLFVNGPKSFYQNFYDFGNVTVNDKHIVTTETTNFDPDYMVEIEIDG